ncbi:MAG: hypothetical protein K9M99_07225 [Candidatus Cloacimonetes bacterium]|nr:hypothetical protein [Candidatus Cloacimonadota bacterium]
MKKMMLIIAFYLLLSSAAAEITISDSLDAPYRSPIKAGLLSALLPGGGQIYNQSYIKAGAVVVIEGLFLGYAIKNHQEADKYYDLWKETDSQFDFDRYEHYYEKRENDIWWLGITIFLSTLDAVTDAYLYDFEYQKQKVRLKFKDKSVLLEYKF